MKEAVQILSPIYRAAPRSDRDVLCKPLFPLHSMQPPPTTRSRTLLFLSYRDSRAQSSRFKRPSRSIYDDNDNDDTGNDNDNGDDEHQRLISHSDSVPSHSLPPAWYIHHVSSPAPC